MCILIPCNHLKTINARRHRCRLDRFSDFAISANFNYNLTDKCHRHQTFSWLRKSVRLNTTKKLAYDQLNNTKPAMKPLNADARARLSYPSESHACSYSTSGSEHDSLSYLVHEFFENEYEVGKSTLHPTSDDDSDSDDMESGLTDRAKQAADEIRKLLKPRKKRDPFRLQLYSDVEEAVEALAPLKANRSGVNRAVMTQLREKGYDSGLCKARWEGSKGLAPGNYEYIDVMQPAAVDGKKERYIVDVYFAAESEVAGPTDEYQTVLSALPEMALARQEEMRRVLRILADEAKRSLKSRGLSVPPWRKKQFLMAKWLGPYRRTTNPVPASMGMAAGSNVKCRAVGFVVPQLHWK